MRATTPPSQWRDEDSHHTTFADWLIAETRHRAEWWRASRDDWVHRCDTAARTGTWLLAESHWRNSRIVHQLAVATWLHDEQHPPQPPVPVTLTEPGILERIITHTGETAVRWATSIGRTETP